ncbi:MAG TPA: sigma-70 region 4 domain-containing protein [Gemmatimonadaceae bacterium]|nr:sigma-70 region 4 domain-containing protein [Gemmatimonadaceae bacterium]
MSVDTDARGTLFALALRLVRSAPNAEFIVRQVSGMSRDVAAPEDLRRAVIRCASRLLRGRHASEAQVRAAEVRRYTAEVTRLMPDTDPAVERAIASLPDRTRCILVLRDIESYTPAEITGLLGVSEKTVRQRIREARRLVRYQLES